MPSLEPAATAFEDALRALDRSLDLTRPAWNDVVRQGFDRRYATPILAQGKRAAGELRQLARDLAAAIRLLDGSA